MSKAKLEYDLTDPDDTQDFYRANKSLDMACVLWEFAYNTKRHFSKYRIPKDGDDFHKAVDEIFDRFDELIEENDINLDKIIS